MSNWARIWVDGSATIGDTPGGWAFVAIEAGAAQTEKSGMVAAATNQQMEITAAAMGVNWAVNEAAVDVAEIISDSAYVVNCMNDRWYEEWRDNGWVTSSGKAVSNRAEWQRLLIELADADVYGVTVKFTKTKGHGSDMLNARADHLANEARRGMVAA